MVWGLLNRWPVTGVGDLLPYSDGVWRAGLCGVR